jgi:uncharacterized OB-fold protein
MNWNDAIRILNETDDPDVVRERVNAMSNKPTEIHKLARTRNPTQADTVQWQCQECGRKWKNHRRTCPKCGSTDVDIAV